MRHVDIAAVECIYGTNVAVLKGKTVSRPGNPIAAECDPVPNKVMSLHPSVILSVDVMYVNGVMFLVTTSRTICFGTIKSIPNHCLPTFIKALSHVLALYHHQHFQVAMVYADPEFQPLQDEMPATPFDFVAQGQHVPDIERYIRTVKDHAHSHYSQLPFQQIPRIVLI